MRLEEMVPVFEKLGVNLYQMALYQNGQIEEHRFQPCNNCSNCYSVAKAFSMTAVGMLQDDGKLDVKKPLRDYMPDLIPGDADPMWQEITVENALTHRLGFGEGFLDIDVENVSEYPTDDYLSIVFHHPLSYRPGEHYQYSDAAYYIVSRLVSQVTGEKLDVFLNRRLFQPLGFHEAAWSHCPKDHPMGATGLYISAWDMVKLPALYLENGVLNGKRILSREWVSQAICSEYEMRPRGTTGLIGKGGMYGQMILFSRERCFAIAWTAHLTDDNQLKQMTDCLDRLVIQRASVENKEALV